MRTARRFVNDESGMTLALAVIMIVLIGVMGAGLLTFVMKDLNTVTEQNRAQRAFEIAEAGIGAAKRQLAANVDRTKYDNPDSAIPADNIQWAYTRGGMTLNNLDGDGTTSDSVNVQIEFRGSTTDDFRVVSEGTYGTAPQQAKRKIEAIFKGVQAGAGSGTTIGHPLYYTPSNIKILSNGDKNDQVTLTQVSLFSRGDILIQDYPAGTLTSQAAFTDDMEDKGNASSTSVKTSGNDELCNWNTKTPMTNCFQNDTGGMWNTVSRPDRLPGMGAEGYICSFANTSRNACPSATIPNDSYLIADGIHGFDRTTTPKFEVKPCQLDTTSTPTSCPDNDSDKITYPFPLPKPIPAGLKGAACAPAGTLTPGTNTQCTKTPPPVSYFEGIPTDANWGLDTSDASNSRVTFIDAQNQVLTYNPSDAEGGGQFPKGIIVVWCGRLVMEHSFSGIILNLVGDNLPGNTQCTKDTATVGGSSSVGTYENHGKTCKCWVYAEGGTSTTPGVQLDPKSDVQFRPSADWSFQNGLFLGPPPTSFKLYSWRELYS